MRALRISPIVPVAVLAFIATVALMIWRNREPEGSTQPVNNESSAQTVTASRETPALAAAPTAPAPADTALASAAPQVEHRSDQADQPGDEATDLPVRVYLQYRHLRIYNTSMQELPVDVSDASSRGGPASQVSLVIGPHQQKELSTSDGLQLDPSDTITVKSPKFRTLVQGP
jgi:hypothetical protein